jgi:hypothetical protein
MKYPITDRLDVFSAVTDKIYLLAKERGLDGIIKASALAKLIVEIGPEIIPIVGGGLQELADVLDSEHKKIHAAANEGITALATRFAIPREETEPDDLEGVAHV